MKKLLTFSGKALFLFFAFGFSFAQDPAKIGEIQKANTEKGMQTKDGEIDISRMTQTQLNSMMGGLPPEPGTPDRPREGIDRLAKARMPSFFSWGNYGGYNWLTSIKNQGGCGSCWAFASSGDFEVIQRLRLNQPTRDIDASEQNMVSCWKGDCGGTTLDWTLGNFQGSGSPDEACFPYSSGGGGIAACANRCADWTSRAFLLANWGRYTSPTVATIKAEIQNYGPVMTWMQVYQDFQFPNYTGGVYVHTWGAAVDGHFIILYGWDDANNCWLAKNSWGTGWGENGPDGTGGWFRIRMGTNEAGCESWVYWLEPAALPNLVHTTRAGWSHPVVARNAADANSGWCPVSATLPGNSNSTYLNWAYLNNGSSIARDILGHVFIDAEWYVYWHWLEFLNAGVTDGGWLNVGPVNIRGGRHTICDSLDWDNTVFETQEWENPHSQQFVWSPYVLTENTPVERWAPPWKGYLTYPNSDGFQFTRPGGYASGMGIIPHNASDDYDLYLYSDYSGSESGFSDQIASSAWIAGYSDFVIGTYTSWPQTTCPAVVRYNNQNDNFHIDATSSVSRVGTAPKAWNSNSLPANRVLNVYEVRLVEGKPYYVKLKNLSGNADLGLSIYSPRAGFYGKSFYKAISNSSAEGGNEGFYYTADTTGYYVAAIWKNGSSDYWKSATYTLEAYRPGDASGDLSVSVSDVVYLVNYLFKGGAAPAVKASGDVNNDCSLTISDVVYLVNYLFKGGAAPQIGCA